MGKRVQKNSVNRVRDKTGCMSGLISIFDFRQVRPSQKLLPERRYGSNRHSFGIGYPKNKLKLLSDSDRTHEGKNDEDENRTSKIDICRTSVKKLMEEEMYAVQQPKKKIRTASVDSQEPEYSHLDLVSLMEEFCNHVHQRLHHENKGDSSDGQEFISSVSHGQLDELDLQLVQKHTILEEKLSEAAEAFLNQKFIDSGQTTDGAKIHQTKQFMDALDILNSNKELLLKLLEDSNSLLVKHIEDLRDSQSEKPKKSLARSKSSSEEIDNSTQCQELIIHKQIRKQNMYKYFWRKVKSENKNLPKDLDSPRASNRIVVLKPNPAAIKNSVVATSPRSSTQFRYGVTNQEQGRELNSKFSLRGIKNKLKRVMGESKTEQHRISMDAILHKIPCEHQDSADCSKELLRKIHSRNERAEKPMNYVLVNDRDSTSKRDDTSDVVTMEASVSSRERESNIYLEAKKHLFDMLNNREEDLNISTTKVPKSLGKTLSLPEFVSSPVYSPRDSEHTAQMRVSFSDNLGVVTEKIWQPVKENSDLLIPSRKNIETEPQTDDDIKLQILDLNPDTSHEIPDTVIQESIVSSEGDSSAGGGAETVETIKSVSTEKSKSFDDLSETNSSMSFTGNSPSTETVKTWEEEGSSKSLMDENKKNEPSTSSLGSFSSSCSLDQKVESVESINDGEPAWESPVSVLKPFFVEDVTSPATPKSNPAELKIQPVRICFDECDSTVVVVTPSDTETHLTTCMEDKKPTFEYVRAVLRASGLNWDEFTTNYRSSNHLLDASLFDEVDASSSRLCGEPELIFDCINEVLVQVYWRYFGCPPWLKFIKSNIRPAPMGSSIIEEVWESIDWHLKPQPQPCTLDHIVGKDFAKEGTWLDLQFDIEEVGIEISEAILIELMQEIVVNLCS